MIYLDFAASTPVLPEVMEAMQPWFTEYYANPSSSHQMGRMAAEAIEEARATIADKIGAYPSEIIFTSGATESNNLAIKGIAWAHRDKGRHIITSAIEHKCVLAICAYLEKEGFEVTYIDPTPEGVIEPERVKEAMRDDTILVSIMHVNNELGTIQPIEEIGKLCFDRGIFFHTDAAQSFCKLDIDVDDMNIDLMSISGHKIYGPKGIGALYIRDSRETRITPVIHGAGQEMGLRGGTLATPLIQGLSCAAKLIPPGCSRLLDDKLGDYCYERLNDKFSIKRNGINTVQNIVSISFIKDSEFLLFSNKKILISNGSACSSQNIESSHVLKSISISDSLARKTVRLSLGYKTTKKSIDEIIEGL